VKNKDKVLTTGNVDSFIVAEPSRVKRVQTLFLYHINYMIPWAGVRLSCIKKHASWYSVYSCESINIDLCVGAYLRPYVFSFVDGRPLTTVWLGYGHCNKQHHTAQYQGIKDVTIQWHGSYILTVGEQAMHLILC